MKGMWGLLAGTSLAALAVASPAFAQEEDAEIVVTGSQIRGIAPAGAQVIGLGAEQIEETGAASGNDILSQIPQVSNFFNAMPNVGGNNPFGIGAAPISRPNLRSLPGNNTNSSSFTLVLIDGHRVTPGGLIQVAVDPDAVPPSLLERVEISPDGASAIYGSDAVGGVINFITRSSFDGVEASGRWGFAEDYEAWDGSVTAGTDWGSGSVFGSFRRSYHDPLFGYNRDYIQEINWAQGQPTSGLGVERACAPGNISISTRTYPLTAAGVPQDDLNLPNACDGSDYRTFYSEGTLDSFMGGISQEFSDTLQFDVRGFFTRREDITYNGPFRASPSVTAANPNYRSVAALTPGDAGATQTVRFSYENVLPLPERLSVLETWQITPSLTWDVGGDWQIRALATYGENETSTRSDAIHTATQTARINSGLINPYNVGASGAGAFDNLIGQSRTIGAFEFENYRVIGDGPLLALPGGQIRAAVGAEQVGITFSRRQTDANFALGAPISYDQTADSVFGEVQVPIIGEGNRLPFVESLSLSASVRRDDYSDFGETTNPSLGITYEPLNWVTFRGMWGESFVAPSATVQLGTSAVGLIVGGTPGFTLELPPGAPPPPPGAVSLLLNMGSVDTLEPQTSENWSMGVEVRPPFIDGLTLGATYYAIDVQGLIGSPLNAGQAQLFAQYPHLVRLAPPGGFSQAEINQWVGFATPAAQASYAPYSNTAVNPVVALIDNRARNLGDAWVEGLDFSARYVRDLEFGSLDFSIAGNREVISITQNGAGLPINNLLAFDTPRYKWSAGAGLSMDNLRARVTWNHTAGYDVNPALNNGQREVDAFDTVDTFFAYELGGEGLTEDLTLSLNVNNIFDEDPPILRRQGFQNFGYANTAFTVGRFVQFGISKRF